jgi:hypothetical protein
MATYEVTGPTDNAVVVCKFAGLHGTARTIGWVIYKPVIDMKAGESTRDTCTAISFPPLGDEPPSQPLISITTVSGMGSPPADWDAQYVPPTPWP